MAERERTYTDDDAMAAPTGTRTTERFRTVAPGQIVSLVVGAAFIVVGVIAIVRAELDGSLADPVVEVLGYTHTAWLGIAEVAVGVILLLAGSTVAGRSLSCPHRALIAIAGALVLAIPEDLPEELGLEEGFGWPLLISGIVVAVAAMLMPAWRSHTVDHQPADMRGH